MRVMMRRMAVAGVARGGIVLEIGRAFARAGTAGAGIHIGDELADRAGASATLRAAAQATIDLPSRPHGRLRFRHCVADLPIRQNITRANDHRGAEPK